MLLKKSFRTALLIATTAVLGFMCSAVDVQAQFSECPTEFIEYKDGFYHYKSKTCTSNGYTCVATDSAVILGFQYELVGYQLGCIPGMVGGCSCAVDVYPGEQPTEQVNLMRAMPSGGFISQSPSSYPTVGYPPVPAMTYPVMSAPVNNGCGCGTVVQPAPRVFFGRLRGR